MKEPEEGYVLACYGERRYLKQALASVRTLRRYDPDRPVALFTSEEHRRTLVDHGLTDWFDVLAPLPADHRSIVGFKHHLGRFQPYDRTIWTDVDVLWCRDPDPLWRQLSVFTFTITGVERADHWFGATKGPGVILDYLLDRRRRTLERFGLTYLPRVQSGLIYARDRTLTERVCRRARLFLERRGETHFRTRLSESGRSLESCEWSLAMAMSDLDVPVFPWLQGLNSPQLDYISDWTRHDEEFREVRCRYYTDPRVYALRGLSSSRLRRLLTAVLTRLPGGSDRMEVTPFLLHFGWMHEKEVLDRFADRCWRDLVEPSPSSTTSTPLHG